MTRFLRQGRRYVSESSVLPYYERQTFKKSRVYCASGEGSVNSLVVRKRRNTVNIPLSLKTFRERQYISFCPTEPFSDIKYIEILPEHTHFEYNVIWDILEKFVLNILEGGKVPVRKKDKNYFLSVDKTDFEEENFQDQKPENACMSLHGNPSKVLKLPIPNTSVIAFPLFEFSKNLDEFVQREIKTNGSNSLRNLSSSSSSLSTTTSSSSAAATEEASESFASASFPFPLTLQNAHSMNMEMIRLETFNHFPKSCSVSTLRLAKDGFYYSGKDDIVICFSCGVHRGGWEPLDNPRDIHKQISPNCKLFNSSESQNIEIGRENSTETQTLTEHFDQTNRTEIPPQQRISEDVQASLTNTEFQTQETLNTESYETTNGSQQSRVYENRNRRIGCRTRALQEKINAYLRNLDPLGINFDRPKYPEYAVLAVRESSFKDWPSTLTQTPQSLAKSGFMYMGYGDYTRCFFCAGGLRNWEPGDDPWTEHARWFPKCAFLRQNKGDEFVALVQIKHQEAASHENEETGAEQNCEITTLHTNMTQNSSNEAMFDLPSVQSVLEMGYSRESVKEAFDLLEISQDSEQISGEELLEIILSKEEHSEETGTLSSGRNVMRNSREVATFPGTSSHQNLSLSGRLSTNHKISKAASNLPEPNADTLSGKAKLDENMDTNVLMEENRQLRESMFCKICMENEAAIAMLPCGHLCCCTDCAPAMRKCPICRQFVKGTVRTWLI